MLEVATNNFEGLDLGCGTGASSKVISKYTKEVTAVDFLQEFVEKLNEEKISNIKAIQGNMDDLSSLNKKFDLVWCEGAIYNIGFKYGLDVFRNYLKDDGYMVISEIVWLKDTPSTEAVEFWNSNYPKIDTIAGKKDVIEKSGYKLIDYFVLPEQAWNNYYTPLLESAKKLEEKYGDEVKELVEETRHESEIYERNKTEYSYAFFIMKK